MTPRHDPRIFCGPPMPLDTRPIARPGVVFTGEEQPRDDQGRYQEQPRATQGRYRGEVLTPAYRRRLLGYSAIGRQILTDEDAVSRIVAHSRT